MATHVMDVYRLVTPVRDDLWAICIDGGRLITHWGPRTADQLRGGGPAQVAGTLMDAFARLVREQTNAGYQFIGKRSVVDGVVQEEGAQESDRRSRLLPSAYTEIPWVRGWQDIVKSLFERAAAFRVELMPDRVLLHVDACDPIHLLHHQDITVAAKPSHGPRGLLAVLAIAKAFNVEAYAGDGPERDGRWLSEEPQRFEAAGLSYEDVKAEAAMLGVIAKPLTYKANAKPLGLFG